MCGLPCFTCLHLAVFFAIRPLCPPCAPFCPFTGIGKRTDAHDRTLIDAPLGFDQHKHPGRVAPSWWTLQNAEECLMSGKRDVMYAFLHDVERPGS